ncbi:tautomerase family protein [Methylocapsa sp. S129]|uniref:tautomerase family protein n=1 Tax=Methylocapsa sp. S129 TaxID=1641869 RepID=UPI00131C4CAF|nr:tautomerase family protein [Methylocapsa sp. S129]
MPAFICETRAGLNPNTKATLARAITDVVNDIIQSPFDLISVVFHDLRAEDTYRAGDRTMDTLIFGHIRQGRTDATIQKLGLAISETWSRITGVPESEIEIAIEEYPAKFTFRGGERLPEPPYV